MAMGMMRGREREFARRFPVRKSKSEQAFDVGAEFDKREDKYDARRFEEIEEMRAEQYARSKEGMQEKEDRGELAELPIYDPKNPKKFPNGAYKVTIMKNVGGSPFIHVKHISSGVGSSYAQHEWEKAIASHTLIPAQENLIRRFAKQPTISKAQRRALSGGYQVGKRGGLSKPAMTGKRRIYKRKP